MINSEPAAEFLTQLNSELQSESEKKKKSVKTGSFYTVVEKAMIQTKLSDSESAPPPRVNKRKFRKISKKLMLVTLFAPSSRISPSPGGDRVDGSSLSYFSCNSSLNISFSSARNSFRHLETFKLALRRGFDCYAKAGPVNLVFYPLSEQLSKGALSTIRIHLLL